MAFRVFGLLAILLAWAVSAVDAVAYAYNGVDVSHWQGTINWSQVHSSGISFAFTKASESTGYLDPTFETNMQGAKAAGILAGGYHFARPDVNPGGAVAEADWFVGQIGDYVTSGYLRPVLDLEKGASLGKTALSAWVCNFTSRVKSLTGSDTIIYCNTNYAKNYLNNTVAGNDLWIANWTYDTSASPGTGVWSDWDFWQWSNQGNTTGSPAVAGISGRVDLDVCRINPVAYAVPEPPALVLLFVAGAVLLATRWFRAKNGLTVLYLREKKRRPR